MSTARLLVGCSSVTCLPASLVVRLVDFGVGPQLVPKRAPSLVRSASGEHNGDDESVKGESLGEDHHENKSDKDISLSISTDTSVTDDTDAEASSEGGETTAEASTELLVGSVVVVVPVRGGGEVGSSVFNLGNCDRRIIEMSFANKQEGYYCFVVLTT